MKAVANVQRLGSTARRSVRVRGARAHVPPVSPVAAPGRFRCPGVREGTATRAPGRARHCQSGGVLPLNVSGVPPVRAPGQQFAMPPAVVQVPCRYQALPWPYTMLEQKTGQIAKKVSRMKAEDAGQCRRWRRAEFTHGSSEEYVYFCRLYERSSCS